MSSEASERERLESSLIFWRKMMAQLDTDGLHLQRLLNVSPGVVVAAYALGRSWLLGLVVALFVVSVWGMGRYMIMVRRTEYAYHLTDIQQQLRNLPQQHLPGPVAHTPKL